MENRLTQRIQLRNFAMEEILKQTSNTLPLGDLSKTSESKPWEVPTTTKIEKSDFSSEIVITRSNMLYIPLNQLSSKVLNHLRRIASFRNPEFYGLVIADECHHVSAINFEQILKAVNARYVYGLTATPIRKDGHQPIIFMQCGPIRYNADAKAQMRDQTFQRLLVPRFTPFRPVSGEDLPFTKVAQQLAEDEYRNLFIVKDVIEALKEGRSPIILTSRTAHVEILADLLKPHCPNVITLVGSENTKEKRLKMEYLQSIPSTEPLIIVATGKYVGEGFDYARLDTLFLVSPVAWKGIVAQYAGRLHREFDGKQDVQIYDYIDIRVPVCESMYRKRLKGYASIGYRIRNNEMFDSLFPTIDIIYDGLNFESPFISDLSRVNRSVVISCPKLKTGGHSQIVNRLIDLVANGKDIVLYKKEESDDTYRLQHQGISVIFNAKLSICTAIIDKSTIWYGSVNILGYRSAEDNLIRFKNLEIATSLFETLHKDA